MRVAALLFATLLLFQMLPFSLPLAAAPEGRSKDPVQEPVNWVNPNPTGASLYSATATPGKPALIVGARGTILKWSGSFSQVKAPTDRNLRAADWKAGGSGALIAGESGTLLLYNPAGDTFTHVATGTTTHLRSVAWRPQGDYALVGGYSGLLMKYDGGLSNISSGVSAALYDIAWRPQGDYALIVGDNGTLLRYDSSTGARTLLSTGTGARLFAVAWKVDGSSALVAGANGTAFFHDGSAATPLTTGTTADLFDATWAPDGSGAMLAGTNGTLLKYTGAAVTPLASGVQADLRGLAWSGQTLLIAGTRGTVLQYESGIISSVVRGPTTSFYAAAWRPQGDYMLAAGEKGSVITCAADDTIRVLNSTVSASLYAVTWSADGAFALIGGSGGTLLRYDHSTGNFTALNSGVTVALEAAAWKPGGTYALVVGDAMSYLDPGVVLKVDGATAERLSINISSVRGNLYGVSWRPQADYAIIAGASGGILKYEEKPLNPFTKMTSSVYYTFFSVDFSPSGNTAALGTNYGNLLLFDATKGSTGSDAFTLVSAGTAYNFQTVAWEPGGSYLLAGASDGSIYKYYDHGFVQVPATSDLSLKGIAWKPKPANDRALLVGNFGAVLRYALVKQDRPNAVISSPANGTVFPPDAGVFLDGTNSTPTYGDRITFQWVSNISGILGAQARFSRALAPGTHRITLFTNDTLGASDSDWVVITVPFPNRPPDFGPENSSVHMVAAGAIFRDDEDIRFDAANVTDPDGDALNFTWVSNRSGFLNTSARFTARLPPGLHRITLWVDDGHGHNVSLAMNITVYHQNNPPAAVIATPAEGQSFSDTEKVTFDGTASDPDGDAPLTYAWHSNRSGLLGTGSRLQRSLPAGIQRITLNASDGSMSGSAVVNITIVHPNTPPVVSIESPGEGAVARKSVLVQGFALDSDGDAVEVSWRMQGDTWAAVPLEAALREGVKVWNWNFTLDTLNITNGTHTLYIRVSDGTASTQSPLNITIDNRGTDRMAINITAPVSGAKFRGKIVAGGTARALSGSLERVEVSIDGKEWKPANGTANWTFTMDTSKLKNGPHMLSARAFDGKDYSAEAVVAFVVENKAPPRTPGAGAVEVMLLMGLMAVALFANSLRRRC